MQGTTLSFRAGEELADQTRALAKASGQKTSDYIRDAVREKNEREMASRIAMLSRKLSAKHLAASEDMDASAGDGLD
ncbi:MAG: antitoxin of toxin-antitoxin stability system [Cupriavidus necator]|uniref:antitoxin n=1 Tax=unclassified Cupriavidus TaxID=2640874 RepID=UPI0003A7F7D4|nr:MULTISPECIES: antitoxin [unclassified Cupriavidus]EYS80495.1 antitoxin of toxin-antitoxin stability system [Cupriavidus sp. SK-4]UIF91085.1 antitoxin of toxin-antitoxin stability system [Cupriavidus necator]